MKKIAIHMTDIIMCDSMYTAAAYATAIPSVRPSQAWFMSKRLYVSVEVVHRCEYVLIKKTKQPFILILLLLFM